MLYIKSLNIKILLPRTNNNVLDEHPKTRSKHYSDVPHEPIYTGRTDNFVETQ